MPSTSKSAPQPQSARQPSAADVVVHRLDAHEFFPNSRLPVLLYRAAFKLIASANAAATIEKTFVRNGWSSGWRDGVYNYHHYHSTAHEVLGCYAGRALIQVGGPDGPVLEFKRGDVLLLPAGATHKSPESSKDFSVVGAYAQGRPYDLRRGREEELIEAERHISEVPLPERDPVYGENGPLKQHWT
jgi:uncharacterized protein YjlB